MPNTQSAKKALRQSARRSARNAARKKAYKDAVKRLKKAARAGINESAQALLSQVYKTLDKAAKTRVIKKNKASRLKSRLTRLTSRSKASS